ncbi:putative FAD-binding domain-containing protein [Seiridium cardinale]|uniref:FAD-binding domain-containing protein n=1 Tax=Seiridium cardinale TaxID=138064 RepID=A0ABR2XW93_9PEZI
MQSSPQFRPHVLIIGAGIGGLLLAQALRKQGIPFEIFERDKSKDAVRQGGSLALHTILDDVRASIPDDLPPLESTNNLLPLDLVPEFAAYSEQGLKTGVRDDGSGKIIRANRHRLRKLLSTNIEIQYGKQFVRTEEKEDLAVVHFQDGSSATGDIVVGADGARSVVRKQVLGKQNDLFRLEPVVFISAELELSGEVMWQQLRLGHSMYRADFRDKDGKPLHFFLAANGMAPDGKSGKFYCHVIWEDEAATKDNFWVHSATNEQLHAGLIEKTATLPARYRAVVDHAKIENMWTPPLRQGTLVMRSMPAGRVTLLGDAAHAMTPFRGEGGCHAMEDAVQLARALRTINRPDKEHIASVLGAYQEKMLERGSEAAYLSQFRQVFGAGSKKTGEVKLAGQIAGILPDE